MIKFDSDQKIFFSTLINDDKYFGGFGTKALGDGRNIDTSINFFRANIPNFKTIVIPEQIHSVNVTTFSANLIDNVERVSETDGVITKDQNSVLTVITADCCPMMFVDKKNEIIGISHQGWRGSVKRLGQKMVEKILDSGGKKEDILVAIGPSIGQCCYDIDDERYYEFLEEFEVFADRIFLLAFFGPLILQPFLIYIPLLSGIFKITQVSFIQLILVVALSAVLLVSSEIRKAVSLRRNS